jgi:hypothetical protein
MEEMVPAIRVVKTAEEHKEERQKALVDRTVAIVAILSALTALVTIYFAHRDAKEAMVVSRNALNAQIETVRLDERPYVRAGITDFAQDGPGDYSVRILLSASGRTPAFNVSYDLHCQGVSGTTPTFVDRNADVQVSVMASGDTFRTERVVCEHSVNEPTFVAPFRVYVWGTVFYRDVYKQPHKSQFCYSTIRQKDGSNSPPHICVFQELTND